MRYLLSLAMLLTLGPAADAAAQPHERPDVEVGVGGGAVASWFLGGGAIGGGDIRVAAPISDRSMVEAIVAATPMQNEYVAGFYGVQVKRRMGREHDADTQPFITFGLLGSFAHGDDHTFVSPPLIGLLGAGVQQRVADRLAVRVEAQAIIALVIPVGARVAVGLSVPVGRHGYGGE
jgi:hypothetical protein